MKKSEKLRRRALAEAREVNNPQPRPRAPRPQNRAQRRAHDEVVRMRAAAFSAATDPGLSPTAVAALNAVTDDGRSPSWDRLTWQAIPPKGDRRRMAHNGLIHRLRRGGVR